MLMNNNKLVDLLAAPVGHLVAAKASQVLRASMISSDRDRAEPEAKEIHSATFSRNSRKCSAAEDRGAHQGGHNSRPKDKTLL